MPDLAKKAHLFSLNYPQISPRIFQISSISTLNAWLRIPMRIQTIWRQDKSLPKTLITAHLRPTLAGFSQQRTDNFATNPAAQQINPSSAGWMSSLKALQGYIWMATREPWLLLIKDQPALSQAFLHIFIAPCPHLLNGNCNTSSQHANEHKALTCCQTHQLSIQHFICFLFLPLDHLRPTRQPSLSVILSTRTWVPWHFASRGAVFQIQIRFKSSRLIENFKKSNWVAHFLLEDYSADVVPSSTGKSPSVGVLFSRWSFQVLFKHCSFFKSYTVGLAGGQKS